MYKTRRRGVSAETKQKYTESLGLGDCVLKEYQHGLVKMDHFHWIFLPPPSQ